MRHVLLELLALWIGASIPIAFVLGRWMMQPKPTAAPAVEATSTVAAKQTVAVV